MKNTKNKHIYQDPIVFRHDQLYDYKEYIDEKFSRYLPPIIVSLIISILALFFSLHHFC